MLNASSLTNTISFHPAPSNDAFAALPSGTLEALLADPDTLNQVLMHHNVPGILNSSDLVPGETLTTAIGDELTVSVGTDTSMCPCRSIVCDVPLFRL